MPTRSNDQPPQPPSHRLGTIPKDTSALPVPNEPEVVYELQDNEFVLVDPDETIEFQTGPRMPRPEPPPVSALPPLPAWAAASRAMLDGWGTGSTQAERELREAREDLIRFARQTYAREVYVQEVERALAAAQGRVRGQAFRIAELEQAQRAAEAKAWLVPRAASPQPSAAEVGGRAMALVSLRGYVAEVQAPFAGSIGKSFAPAQYIVEAGPAPKPAKVRARRRRATRTASARDDLQRIKGVGPILAQRMAKAGVTSFDSIAAWKVKDIERIAERLGVSRSRIERQVWVKQARELRRRR